MFVCGGVSLEELTLLDRKSQVKGPWASWVFFLFRLGRPVQVFLKAVRHSPPILMLGACPNVSGLIFLRLGLLTGWRCFLPNLTLSGRVNILLLFQPFC